LEGRGEEEEEEEEEGGVLTNGEGYISKQWSQPKKHCIFSISEPSHAGPYDKRMITSLASLSQRQPLISLSLSLPLLAISSISSVQPGKATRAGPLISVCVPGKIPSSPIHLSIHPPLTNSTSKPLSPPSKRPNPPIIISQNSRTTTNKIFFS